MRFIIDKEIRNNPSALSVQDRDHVKMTYNFIIKNTVTGKAYERYLAVKE